MWTQWWIVAAPVDEEATARVTDALAHWTPVEAAPPVVGSVRILRGPDEHALAEQYLAEVEEIREITAKTPRETLARRFAYLRHRGAGIPPRPGWVVLGDTGPRSPRPIDWTHPTGPRWVVEVIWPDNPPELGPEPRS